VVEEESSLITAMRSRSSVSWRMSSFVSIPGVYQSGLDIRPSLSLPLPYG
jgi:hypothetical protein